MEEGEGGPVRVGEGRGAGGGGVQGEGGAACLVEAVAPCQAVGPARRACPLPGLTTGPDDSTDFAGILNIDTCTFVSHV